MTLTFLENQITDAVERLSESVVSINSKKLTMDARFGLVPLEGTGSGIIVDAKGYAVTNNHFIDGADRVWINLKDGRTLTGSHRRRSCNRHSSSEGRSRQPSHC